MSSEIEVVEEAQSNHKENGESSTNGIEEESLKNDVYTAAAYGDLEKLHRLVECEGCSVSEPDGLGYYALQWSALNNRTAVAQYIIESKATVVSPKWKLAPIGREQEKWDRATKAATGGNEVMFRELRRPRGDPEVLAAEYREQYFKLKNKQRIENDQETDEDLGYAPLPVPEVEDLDGEHSDDDSVYVRDDCEELLVVD